MEKQKKRRWVDVEVTQGMIGKAIPGDCHACLIAVALRAATGLVWTVWFGDAKIDTLFGRKPTWKLPYEVDEIRERFDAHKPVEPFTFRLPARFANKERYGDWSCLDNSRDIARYV
jgi:hypothetical protein